MQDVEQTAARITDCYGAQLAWALEKFKAAILHKEALAADRFGRDNGDYFVDDTLSAIFDLVAEIVKGEIDAAKSEERRMADETGGPTRRQLPPDETD